MLGLKIGSGGTIAPVLAALTLTACIAGDDSGASEGSAGATATASDTGTSSATDWQEGTTGAGTADAASGTSGTAATNPTSESEGSTGGGESTTGAGDTDSDLCDGGKCCLYPDMWPTEGPIPVEVTLELTVNGMALPQSDADDGDIFLVDNTNGDRIHVGKTTFGELVTRVFPGEYALVYESESRGPLLPWNRSVVLNPAIAVLGDQTITHDIAVVAAKTAVLVDDAPPPAAATDDGDLFLVDKATGSRTQVARTSLLDGGSFTANLVPGAYAVRYSAHAPKLLMPYNVDAPLADLEVDDVAVFGEPPQLVETKPIAMKTLLLDGDLFFNQEPTPKSSYDHGRLYLRDGVTASVTLIADTSFGRIDKVRILDAPGTYDLVYAMVAHQSAAPVNEWATVREAMSAADLAAEVGKLSLATVSVSGSVTIDDIAPVNDQNNSGQLLLGRGGDRALIGGSTGVLAGVVLAADAYDAFFRHEFSDGGLPANTRGRVQELPIDLQQDPVLDLKIATAMIGGAFKIGSKEPPTSIYDNGRIFLRSGDGDAVHLGLTSDGGYSRRVIHGKYEVFYGVESSKGAVPRNHEVAIGELEVSGDLVDHEIAVPIATAMIPNPILTSRGQGSGRVYLRRLGTSDEIFIGAADQPIFDVVVVPGDYELVYRVDILGENVAANNGAVFDCYRIDADL